MTSVVLYLLTQATLMSPWKDKTRVCGYRRSEFIHWALWRTLIRTEYFLFVHNTTNILAKLNTWCFEHFGDIEPHWWVLERTEHVSMDRALSIYLVSTLENTDENRIFLGRSPHHKHFGKAQYLVLLALWWHQLFFTR